MNIALPVFSPGNMSDGLAAKFQKKLKVSIFAILIDGIVLY